MDPLRLRFLMPGLGLFGVELALVIVPLLALFQGRVEVVVALARVGLPLLGVALIVWAIACERWLAPLYAERAHREPDGAMPAALRTSLLNMPARVLRYRIMLWMAVGVGTAVGLHFVVAMPLREMWMVVSVCVANTACAAVFRASWYEWILEPTLRDLGVRHDTREVLRLHLVARLRQISAACGALALVGVALFIFAFIPVTLEQFQGVQTYFPLTLLMLLTLWRPALAAVVRPVRQYLESATPTAELVAQAYRAAEILPYQLVGLKIAFVLAALGLFVLQAVGLFGFDLERALVCAAAAFFVWVGVGIFESVRHWRALRSLAEVMVRERPELVRSAALGIGLRGKMLYAFGGLAVFVCAFSLYWGFVEYRRLAMGFIEKQAAREVAHISDDLRGFVERNGTNPPAVHAFLRERLGDMDEVVYWLSPDGQRIAVAAHGVPPRLPEPIIESVARRGRGWLDASAIRMQGAFAPVDPALGTLVVLLPGYRGRGPGLEGNLRALVVFFLLLMIAVSGVVGFVARDLAEPVRVLERRAAAMAHGDLNTAVPVGPAPDETGRLAHAFEEMRVALNEKIRAHEELQASLEHKVADRTGDLARSNEELRQALQALHVAQTRLVASGKMAIVGQLVSGIAHEINNPLNAIVNTVEPLKEALEKHGDRVQSADVADMLRVIRSGAERSKRIVQALRNYARGDGEELQEFDVHRSLDEALELLRHELRHGITVERRFEAAPRLRGYPGQLNQVFLNLITNAAQALGGRTDGRIWVETRSTAAALEIAVRDNGAGIAEEILPRIFDPFFTTKQVGEGTGLGLSICQQIIERHGGTIRVSTRPGEGTAFTVVLPVG